MSWTRMRKSSSMPGSSSSRSASRMTHCASSAACADSRSAPATPVSCSRVSANRRSATAARSGSPRPRRPGEPAPGRLPRVRSSCRHHRVAGQRSQRHQGLRQHNPVPFLTPLVSTPSHGTAARDITDAAEELSRSTLADAMSCQWTGHHPSLAQAPRSHPWRSR
jgi:hypothetical protein